jgi:hypothetical protein
MYDRQFRRFDKPKFSGYLRYGDMDGYERKVVRFKSGNNTLAGYICGEGHDKGLVVITHGLGGGAESYLSETRYFVDSGWRVSHLIAPVAMRARERVLLGLPSRCWT